MNIIKQEKYMDKKTLCPICKYKKYKYEYYYGKICGAYEIV